MGEQDISPEPHNKELLFEVYALSHRWRSEALSRRLRVMELCGQPEEGVPPEVMDVMAMIHTYELMDVITGRPVRPTHERKQEVLRHLSNGVISEILLKDGTQDPDLFTDYFRQVFEVFFDATENDEQYIGATDELRHYFAAARRFSQERGDVTLEDVFKDDDLYREFIASEETPEAMAALLISDIESMSFEAYGERHFRVAVELTTRTDPDGLENLHISRTTSIYQAQLMDTYMRLVRAHKRVVLEQVERFWGPEAVGRLPAELLERAQRVRPDAQYVHEFTLGDTTLKIYAENAEIAEVIKKRNMFVNSYCQEKGLDVNALSDDQMMAITELPEWRNPA